MLGRAVFESIAAGWHARASIPKAIIDLHDQAATQERGPRND